MDKLFSLFVKPKAESRRDFLIFLVGISFFCISLAVAFWATYISLESGATMTQFAFIMTFVFFGLGLLFVGVAICFYIWSRRNPAPDPLDKIQKTLESIDAKLETIDAKLSKTQRVNYE